MIVVHEAPEFTRWLAGLRDDKARTAISGRLTRLAFGNRGDVKPVGEGVSELRVHFGPGYRIYLKQTGKSIIVLLCGGNKSSQKRDIAEALRIAGRLKDKKP